ncbi:MAG: hypothetical protein AB7G11_04140 [Phycisphaerales bacterium]
MAMTFELSRPEDLLHLVVRGENLRLDASDPNDPVLVVQNEEAPAYLIIQFPPQTTAETAYFEASIVEPEADPDAPPPPPEPIEALPGAGQVKARVGHPSRLVFRVPAGSRIAFTVEGLLDWSQWQLSVNGIAAIGATPSAAQIAAAPAIGAPGATETSIEMPYRLVISPTADVAWGHRRLPFTSEGRTELWHTRLQLVAGGEAVELDSRHRASLRAIWSPDYDRVSPPLAADQDPDLGRTAMSRRDRHQIVILTSAFHGYEVDRTFSFGGAAAAAIEGVGAIGNLGAINANLIEAGRLRGLALERIDVPIRRVTAYVPQPFFAEQLILSGLGGYLVSRGHWDPPRTAAPSRLFEFSRVHEIFTSRALRGAAGRPGIAGAGALPAAALAREASPLIEAARLVDLGLLVPGRRPAAQEQLDLSEWVHKAAQGRDHYVRIVYEGELLPYRNRAALIKVTERKFREQSGLIVAYLFQRMFIVVREPVKEFTASDRGMTFKRVELTTLVTPDIADPDAPPPPVDFGSTDPDKHRGIIPGTQRSFWVEVMTSTTTRARFKFHGVGTDAGGNLVDFTIPMMFVSISENTAQRAVVQKEYNASKALPLLQARAASVPGQQLLYAERDAAAPSDNSQLVTRSLNFVMKSGASAPTLLMAEVNIPQVQELLGTDAPSKIRLLPGYVQSGLDGATGVFAEIIDVDFSLFTDTDPFAGLKPTTLGVNFSSDQAGGFATPNLGVSTLSRKLGPLAGKAADAISDAFDPASFFQKGLAQLFGTFDLVDLLPAGTLGQNAPKLRTRSEDIPGGKKLIATLDWEPEVKDVDLGIAAFHKDHGGVSRLLIHGLIEKPVTISSLGAPVAQDVRFEFTGTLNDFQVSVLNSVFINFVEFGFTAKSGSKTDVSVKLDPAKPLEFGGDLKFVEELRKAIPPDLFGDGPSLDISPTGIRAGFSFGLPPVAVGVFALKDITLGAALTLPFLDGKPTLDFNVSERAKPFLLSVSIFGGGGFFRLQLDTAGMKMIEAAFEFGATASVDLGVASGGVHIMAGIYFKLERVDPGDDLMPTLTGYLRMGGYLSVLGLIKVSLEFNLSFTYQGPPKEKAYGRATLTVKIEIVFFSISVEVTVEKQFGGKSGDPDFGVMFNKPAIWNRYAAAFA